MNIAIHHDEKGRICGAYSEKLFSEVPEPSLRITNEKWQVALAAGHTHIHSDGTTYTEQELKDEKPSDRRLSACTAIDTAAGAARTRFATNSAFIETEYQRAYDTATAWINSGYQGEAPAPVKSDAEAYGRTDQEAAQFIKATGDGWFTVLDQIRDIRLKGKQTVETTPDDADFMAIAQPFIEQLEALKPQQ